MKGSMLTGLPGSSPWQTYAVRDWGIKVFHFRSRLASDAPLIPYRPVGNTQSWTEEDIFFGFRQDLSI